MKICDTINGNPKEGSRDAARALRRKFKVKNGKVVMLAVTVLEQIMQNCGPELHANIATKEFMSDISALVLNPNFDMMLHTKIVGLVQSWGEGFRHMQDKLPLFYETYSTLKAQGVRFPEYDAASAPIYTLRQAPRPTVVAAGRSVNASQPTHFQQSQPARPPPHQQHQHQRPAATPDIRPARVEEAPLVFDSARLLDDLEQVTTEATLLCDMLDAETQSGGGGLESKKMARELARNCNIYQTRIVTLVEQVQDDEIIVKLLSVNEELLRVLNVFKSRNQPPPHPDLSSSLPTASVAPPRDSSLDALQAHRLPPPPAARQIAAGGEGEADLLGLGLDDACQTHDSYVKAPKQKVKLGAKPLHERKKATKEGACAEEEKEESGAAGLECGASAGGDQGQDGGGKGTAAMHLDDIIGGEGRVSEGAGAGEEPWSTTQHDAATPSEQVSHPLVDVEDLSKQPVILAKHANQAAPFSAPVPAIAPPPKAAITSAAGRDTAKDDVDDLLGI
eukprot:CAMPEP_0173445436 /NCGR_PEP_ID=MMETSP1357-20121228/34357_1 /TAXON_ID=77926 /ORGANISM="Hemiselmis rufescens, Strain PCC563" /LENGTH=505 /DNA_ID=CAMNT_0014411613 /DNA_START=338 /DNA_END=1855 /DNA_ORIENTATION=+